MERRMVQANPTKEFFVNMIVRDIMLKQALIELIDNSLDGAKNIRNDNDYHDLKILVEFDKDKFSITDNCGGIPLDVAENYAFRFGRPKSQKASNTETTGIFGIGMKRALFKMGNNFSIKSKTIDSEFEIDLDVLKWSQDEGNNWDFEFAFVDDKQHNEIENTGTKIIVTNLHKEISEEFSDPEFEREVISHVQRRVGLDISYGMTIFINQKELIGNNVVMINETNVKPVKEEYIDGDVNVKILAGIAPREGVKYSPENAGWYIYCNGRLVIAADKSSLTTWKDLENKSSGVSFHNDYAGFRGVVYFNSKNPERLPWNTTKTGIDETSLIYIKAREKMLEIFKIVKNFLDELKKNTRDNDDGVEEAVAKMRGLELTTQNANNVIKSNRELSIRKVRPIENPNVTITYKREKREVDEIKKMLRATSYKEVGEKTFEYYKDAEC